MSKKPAIFEDWKEGQYKTISFFAKRARGLMARYIVTQNIEDPEALKSFDYEDYRYCPITSEKTRWVFRRKTDHASLKK